MAEDSQCVFCQIVSGSMAASRICEDDEFVAFLDARPLFKGHALVVPRRHVANFTELPFSSLAPLFALVQRICRGLELALGAHGTFVAMNNTVSQSVPHLHVHVVPRKHKDGLRGFFWPRLRYETPADRDAFAERIRTALRTLVLSASPPSP